MNFSLALYWPILLAVFSDIFYQICAKSTPQDLNPFASLTITYLVGAAVSTVIFFLTSGGGNLLAEWKAINWSTFVFGLAIVGLEAGSIYMYKAGWAINTGYIVKAILLAIALIAVGYFLYKEAITPKQIIGIGVCGVGLFLISH